jgi:hypothetical protein
MAYNDPFSFTSDAQLMHVWDDDVFSWDYFNLFDNFEMQLEDGAGGSDGDDRRSESRNVSVDSLTVGTSIEVPNQPMGVPQQMYQVPRNEMQSYEFGVGSGCQFGYPQQPQQDYEWEHPKPLEKNEPCFF